MGGRFVDPVIQYFDDNGDPLAGGLLYFYESGTTTPQDTYSDAGLTTPNANPVVLDSAGRPGNIFANGTTAYRVVVKTSAGVTVKTRDNVYFLDSASILALITDVENTVDSIVNSGAAQNPVRNCTSQAAVGSPSSVTLTSSFLQSNVPFVLGRVTGTLTSGTISQGSITMGSTNTQVKSAGVTGDSSSVVEYAWRIGSKDAQRFISQTGSASVVARQESGVTATATLAIYRANSADNFSAVTLLGSNDVGLADSTNTTIEAAGIALGASAGNGLEIRLSIQPGASFTTKDFYATDAQLAVGATNPTFSPPTQAALLNGVFTPAPVLSASGTVDAITASLPWYLPAPYDGLRISIAVSGPNTSTTPTLNLNDTGAVTITYADGGALAVSDLIGAHDFVYKQSSNRWLLLNPNGTPIPVIDAKSSGAAASFSWPTGRRAVRVRVQGAGGGGGNGATGNHGGGAGGGAYFEHVMAYVSGQNTITYTVGSAGSASSGGNGGAGAASSITYNGVTLTAGGGSGGASSGSGGAGGSGGSVTGAANLGIPGGNGSFGDGNSGNNGNGGGSFMGRGGSPVSSGAGNAGKQYGGGGSGGYNGADGGAGGAGIVIFEY